jgi:4-hydroxyphenylpyruvate dioxygenase
MAAAVTEKYENPVGLDGVEFIEYAGTDPKFFESLFLRYGFEKIAKHPTQQIELYRQGEVNFIVNCQPGTFAADFAKLHGPSICSTGFRVKNAADAQKIATARGGVAYLGADDLRGATAYPAIMGIGDSLVYFMDKTNTKDLYENIFGLKNGGPQVVGHGFKFVDHFTNNVPKGEMDKWSEFYTNVFGFYEIRYFDIKGKSTGLLSKAMGSPDGKFAVPINEPADGKSQIQEYLDEYAGSGIQHVAMSTDDIIGTLESLRKTNLEFLAAPPETYYRAMKTRLPMVVEDVDRLRKNAILVDGDHEGYLLQIFSKNIVGPIFFEVIQRRGHDGFGNGNFQALFDAIEQDQRERGYL